MLFAFFRDAFGCGQLCMSALLLAIRYGRAQTVTISTLIRSHAILLWRLAHHNAAFCRVEVDHVTGRASRVVARNRDGEESVYEADAVIFSVGVTGLDPPCHRSLGQCLQ